MAKLVPEESGGPGRGTGKDVLVVEGEAEGAGGCGNANGRSSGGEMASMEGQLLENEKASDRELDITSSAQKPDRPQGQRKLPRKLPQQQIGKCQNCGYLSSQAICKACRLLEGLNKNRPKMDISFGIEEEESGPTLARTMEGLAIKRAEVQ